LGDVEHSLACPLAQDGSAKSRAERDSLHRAACAAAQR
jgi:hypothetical protein